MREGLRGMLWADLSSEYDARFLEAYLADGALPLGALFRSTLARWARDEAEHQVGFELVYQATFCEPQGELEARLATRRAGVDFAPLEHLLVDEFHLTCLLAYDELATVRAYRANLPRYALLGPEVLRFVQSVTADEGKHYAAFLHVARTEHPQRLAEGAEIVTRIRGTEGLAYANTFLLDHDDADPVWSDAIFDDAARILTRALASGARRHRDSQGS